MEEKVKGLGEKSGVIWHSVGRPTHSEVRWTHSEGRRAHIKTLSGRLIVLQMDIQSASFLLWLTSQPRVSSHRIIGIHAIIQDRADPWRTDMLYIQ